MVARPERLGHFIFNSDYPTDKVIWLYEGSNTTPSEVWGDKEINIDVPAILGTDEMVFVKGVWSIDDWQTSHMLGSTYAAITTSPDKYIDASLGWFGYNSETQEGAHLYILLVVSGSSGTNKPIKYRLWGVQRDGADMSTDYGGNSGMTESKLIFNTDNNYPKLYREGIARGGDVIEHNLGRIPYIDYWNLNFDDQAPVSESWYAYPMGMLTNGETYGTCVQATDTTITFCDDGFGTQYYYRIYA